MGWIRLVIWPRAGSSDIERKIRVAASGQFGEIEPMAIRDKDKARWEAVETRDFRVAGAFVYAVKTTGIYCRPTCPSRRPQRANVLFYSSGRLAEGDGFRACLRCNPDGKHANRVEAAVEIAKALLDEAASRASIDDPIGLSFLAKRTGMSAFHLQRHFKRIVGLTPKAYLTKQKSTLLKKNLKKGGTVLHASYESGFSSPSSAYSAAGKELGMSPSAYRRDAAGTSISFWTAATSLGRVIVAATKRGVCSVMIGSSDRDLLAQLRSEFPKAELSRGGADRQKWVKEIVKIVQGRSGPQDFALDMAGSPFQRRVWDALRRIPLGETRTYGEVAASIGKPGAARAVGRACATNPAAIVVPCHRVVRRDGEIGEYRWGSALKRELLLREAGSARE